MDKIYNPSRNTSLDLLRGIAIVIMVFANSAPYILTTSTPPLLIRIFFSCAAPLFIFLSGYSLNLALKNNKSIRELILRAGQILLIAIAIDVFIWRIVPFETFDVLYLISISQLILILLHPLMSNFKLIILVGLMILFCLLISNFTYRLQLVEHEITYYKIANYSLLSSIKRMLFDGWFPILPWFIISFSGYSISNYSIGLKKTIGFGLGFTFIISSLFVFHLFPHFVNQPREKYLEIFYPVSFPYFLLLIGLFLVTIVIINLKLKEVSLLKQLGKMSLFAYLLHVLLIQFLIIKTHFCFANEYVLALIIGITIVVLIYLLTIFINKLKTTVDKNYFFKSILFILGL